MASQLHLGHVFHLAGSPTVTETAAALVSIADGALVIGKEADFVVVDPSRTPALHGPMTHAVRSADGVLARDQTLFLLLMGMRDTSIAEVHVQGRNVAAS